MPKFSIITPVHLWNQARVDAFLKTIESVRNQTCDDFEWIIINDGSTLPFNWNIVKDPELNTVIIDRVHEERVIAYNDGFREAKGEWFVLLDSDDELVPNALEEMNEFIEEHPRFKMFNFGCRYLHADGGESTRDPFEPLLIEVGHEVFGGGNIVNGTFIWHRSVYEDLGGYGPKDNSGHIRNIDTTVINYGGVRDLYLGTPYDFSAMAQLEFPEMRQFFMVDHENEPNKILKELGNPWGQDYYLFFKYTRKYHSLPIKKYLYLVHPR